jgi:polysaccharide biosynthesis protein PelF
VLLTTEGTYPYAMGGVSSWCDLLVRNLSEFDWHVMPIVAPERTAPAYQLPPQARLVRRIELWSEALPRWRLAAGTVRGGGAELPAMLARGLTSWHADVDELLDALIWCRGRSRLVRRIFRSGAGWASFLVALRTVLDEPVPEAGRPPELDALEAATLYQTLYWVAQTASIRTPPVDVLHVTAAGWAALPAIVHRATHGTPLVLTEHGVYVREAYLAAARSSDSPGSRFISTRLARGLARAAYAAADVVSPVTDANASWEEGLGIEADKLSVIYNGLRPPPTPEPPPGTQTVVSVGRIDPLKDVHTMLHVAQETLRRLPSARFLHYGPVTDGREDYGRSCYALHERLGLGERFRFMGPTREPNAVVRAADVVVMTSISEGLPMSILEAMGEGRPVVATGVGGVPDVVRGCGVVTAPGDIDGLAMAITTLLRNRGLAWALGRRGHGWLSRIFNQARCIESYREPLASAAGHVGGATDGGALRRQSLGVTRTARSIALPAWSWSRDAHQTERSAGRPARGCAPRPPAAGHARSLGRPRGVGGRAGPRGADARGRAHAGDPAGARRERRHAARPRGRARRARAGGRADCLGGRDRLLVGAAR